MQLRENIKASLEKETDPAAILQQVCILMYYYSTGFMLNFPGRLVPTVLEAIKAEIDSEHYSKLIKFQGMKYSYRLRMSIIFVKLLIV